MATNPLLRNQGSKNQGGKNQPPRKQAAKKQAAKKQAAKTQAPKKQSNRNQPNNNQGNRNQGAKKQGGGGTKQAAKNSAQRFLDAFKAEIQKGAGADILRSPNQAAATEALITDQQQNFIREITASDQELEASIAQGDNQTRVTLGSQNLEGVKAQADATKFSATEQAGATKFASQQAAEAEKFSSVQQAEAQKFSATEQARGSIETQRVASESQERQIGLTGEETRKTDLQSELFRRFKEAKDQLDALKAFRA